MPDQQLVDVQIWFQAAVVAHARPDGAGTPTLGSAEAFVRPSATQSPAERVAVYGEAYLARLSGVLAEDYAAVRALTGCTEFESIVRGYLHDHPSRSYTLSVLGRHLPHWIARCGHERSSLLADVARVELAMTRIFDAPRETALGPAAFAAEGLDPDPVLRLIAAHELLELDHDVNDAVTAARRGDSVPTPQRRPTRLLVWRKDDVVWRREIAPAAFALLRAIEGGAHLSAALDAAWITRDEAALGLEEQIPRWLAEWSEDRLFAATP